MKTKLPVILTLIVIPFFASLTAKNLFELYQDDADIYRLRHLRNYGALIEEYYQKVGEYPFQSKKEGQFFVKVAFQTIEQTAGNKEGKDSLSKFYTEEEFRNELSEKLGRDIRLWFDPQQEITTKPLYYLYVQERDFYYFVVYLSNEYPFSTNKRKGYNVVEITPEPEGREGFWKYEDLMRNRKFRKAVNAKPSRTAWFEELEEKNK